MHLSDVSKCFKKGGGFDLKKAKSVTLNTEEINTFITMTEKLPSVMRKILASSVHERKKSHFPRQTVKPQQTMKKIEKKKNWR